jgi:hypothetical protein
MSANRPVHEIRFGHVKAAIWANEVDGATRHNVTLQRLYKDGNGWNTSQSFGRDDLALVVKVSDQAHTWIFQHGQQAASQEQNDSDLPY